jgi:hypothetical protein
MLPSATGALNAPDISSPNYGSQADDSLQANKQRREPQSAGQALQSPLLQKLRKDGGQRSQISETDGLALLFDAPYNTVDLNSVK